MATSNDRPQNSNGNGNGNGTWKWVVSGLAAALMAFAFYVLNINWNIATQYTSKQDAVSHQTEDDRRFDLMRENLDRHTAEAASRFRIHDQEIRTILDSNAAQHARMLLLEARQADVRETLTELRAGQALIGQSLRELKELINAHTREERMKKNSNYLLELSWYDSRFIYSGFEPSSAEPPVAPVIPNRWIPPPSVPVAVTPSTR